jgi:hypothetical protein
MKSALLLGLVLIAAGGCAAAQPLRVFSEFVKVDPKGNVVAPDSPREILSPAIARNAFATYQIVIQVPPETPYLLRIGLNPDNAVKVMLYKEIEDQGSGGRRLEPIEEPYEASSTQVIWMDLWADKNDPVRRVKVEPQLFVNDDWVIYPMEVRVRDPQVPDGVAKAGGLLDAFAVMQAALCKKPLPATTASTELTPAALLYRNANQDVALAESASTADREELKKRLGGCDTKPPENPEAYLRVRDYFFTPYWMRIKAK